MKFITITLFLISSIPHVQAESWLQIADDGDMIECPDDIHFISDKYIINNECYGYDPKDPLNQVIEKGDFEINDNKVRFYNRLTQQESFLSDGSTEQTLDILSKEADKMILKNDSFIFHFKSINTK